MRDIEFWWQNNGNRWLCLFHLLCALTLYISFSVFAGENHPYSAVRDPSVSYQVYMEKARLLSMPQPLENAGSTPVDLAKRYKYADLPSATMWGGAIEMNTRFARVRDHRWMTERVRPNFLRRPSWMFPDDGCYARAALAIKMFSQWKTSVPKKVFVFGDLTVRTKNSPVGSVSWWYHVAPIVEVNGLKYVLDPSIEPHYPLTLLQWLSRMSHRPDELEVAICGSGTYSPYDNCRKKTDGQELMARRDQGAFLGLEWHRLEDLKRSPEQELGDNPPWNH